MGNAKPSEDAFVGAWDCGGSAVTLTELFVTRDGAARQIAYIDTGGNADFGLTLTDGTRYALFDVKRRSLTLVALAERETLACTRR